MVLAVSVVYRGCAVLVAWSVLPAGEKRAWRPEWERLLGCLRGTVPADWTVIVLADRGRYARWLFTTIVGLGWHPFLRVNLGGTFRPSTEARFRAFRSCVPGTDQRGAGTGPAFKGATSRLRCTLLAWHGAGYTDPWLILTDLPPEAADVAWYGLRAWVEQGFKVTKRAGWQWQRTRMLHPDRAAHARRPAGSDNPAALSPGITAPRVPSNRPLTSIHSRCTSPRFVPIGVPDTTTHSTTITRYTVSCIEPSDRFVESQHPDDTASGGSFAGLTPAGQPPPRSYRKLKSVHGPRR